MTLIMVNNAVKIRYILIFTVLLVSWNGNIISVYGQAPGQAPPANQAPPARAPIPGANPPQEPHAARVDLRPPAEVNLNSINQPPMNQPQEVPVPRPNPNLNQPNPTQQQAGFGNPNVNPVQQPGTVGGIPNQAPDSQFINQDPKLTVISAGQAQPSNPSQETFHNQPPPQPNMRQENFDRQGVPVVQQQQAVPPSAQRNGNIQQGIPHPQQVVHPPPQPQMPQPNLQQQPINTPNMPRSGHQAVPPQMPIHGGVGPDAQMQQQAFHQPPVPPMHAPPPHAAGVVFNEEMAAVRQHPDSRLPNQFHGVPGESAPDVYNQARHLHAPDGGPGMQHPGMPHYDGSYQFPQMANRPFEANPPDEFLSMTVVVPPGSKNCYFYTPIIDFIVYYQVVRGGAMDIGLRISDPDGRQVVEQRPMEDGKFSVTVPSHFRMRSYSVCLDNRKASFDEKHTSMMIDIDVNWDNPSESDRKAIEFLRKRSMHDANVPVMHREYAEGWRAIDERVEGLYGRLHRIKMLQQRSNNFASVDKALMESNLKRVFHGSILQMLLMLGVAGSQVVLIRALFDPDSRFYRVWFGKRSVAGTRC